MGGSLLDQTLPDGSPAFFASPSAYALARGMSRTTASKWNRKGLIVLVADPETERELVDAAASDSRREAEQNPLKRAAPSAAKPATDSDLFAAGDDAPASDPEPPESAPAKPPPPEDPYKRSAAEAVSRDKWLALREREMRVREKMGDLGRISDMQDVLFQTIRRVRDTMQRVASECCERANPDDPALANREITAEIDKKLAALGVQLEQIVSGQAPADLPEVGSGLVDDTPADAETAEDLEDA